MPRGRIRRHTIQDTSPDLFNLKACSDWPPTKRIATPWHIPDDGRLKAPRNTHHYGACYVLKRGCGSFSHASVFQRLLQAPHSDGGRAARKEASISRRVPGRIFIGLDGTIVKMQGDNMRTHGGFKEEAVHPILQVRHRWRMACGTALFKNKDTSPTSQAMQAHHKLKTVARAAMATCKIQRNKDDHPWSHSNTPVHTTRNIHDCLDSSQSFKNQKNLTLKTTQNVSDIKSNVEVQNPKSVKPHCLPKQKVTSVQHWCRKKPSDQWKPPYFSGQVRLLQQWEDDIQQMLIDSSRVDGQQMLPRIH